MTVMTLDDALESVKQDPYYGYDGRIHEIRRIEYPHLGGIFNLELILKLNVQTPYISIMQVQLRTWPQLSMNIPRI
jgi:hypothetical protein